MQSALRESILAASASQEEETAPSSTKAKKSKKRRKRRQQQDEPEATPAESQLPAAGSIDDVDRLTRDAFRQAREREQMRETHYDLSAPAPESHAAGVPGAPPPGLETNPSEERIRELEEENARLQQEVSRLKQAQELEHSHSKRELVMQVLDLKESSSEMARVVSELQEELQRVKTREHELMQERRERRASEA